MALAIFDLDNTLLAGDSDYLWGVFLAELGVVDRDQYERENERFYQEYREGRLDIHEFLRFSLGPLSQHPPARLADWHRQFMASRIEPILLPAAQALLDRHRAAGDRLLIVTATNAFVTGPIARRLGVADLLATEPEWREGRYTGAVAGIPCFQEGKVTRLRAWLEQQGEQLAGSYFYSDSHNDLPLLSQVEHPVAVDPDPALRHHALARGWPVISLRDGSAPTAPGDP
jgi:HAD superfamily hydrolase (TIGR01490 family)